MDIALVTGRTPDLAKKEIEAAATILPFQWSSSILQPGVVQLKLQAENEDKGVDENGLRSKESQKMLNALRTLQKRLGGTLKITRIIGEYSVDEIENQLLECFATLRADGGKVTFGISLYGKGLSPVRLGLAAKQKAKKQGFSVRFVAPSEGDALSTAQIFHNKLAVYDWPDKPAREFNLFQQGQKFLMAVTLTVQDINAYSKRDFSIPFPDPVSGMLSPKLAQTMINLAVGGIDRDGLAVYDPFCGNGRILSEAMLMGYTAYGSDIEQKKVEATQGNLKWLVNEFGLTFKGSMADHVWQQDAADPQAAHQVAKRFEGEKRKLYLVTEPYLGRPLRAALRPDEEKPWVDELQVIYSNFLQSWKNAPLRPEKMIVVFPQAKLGRGGWLSLYSILVDNLADLGYSSSVLSHYERPDALVSREIVEIVYRSK